MVDMVLGLWRVVELWLVAHRRLLLRRGTYLNVSMAVRLKSNTNRVPFLNGQKGPGQDEM